MKFFIFAALVIHMSEACLKSASSTVHIQNYDGPIYVNPGDNLVTTNHKPTTYDTRCSLTTTGATTYDNRNPLTTYDNCYPKITTNNNPSILHNPCHQSTCDSDCKCVTKQQSYVPIPVNSVPQNGCTPSYQYPEGYYGYVYPDYTQSDVCTPKITDALIPLLKTYLSQNKPTCSVCGYKH